MAAEDCLRLALSGVADSEFVFDSGPLDASVRVAPGEVKVTGEAAGGPTVGDCANAVVTAVRISPVAMTSIALLRRLIPVIGAQLATNGQTVGKPADNNRCASYALRPRFAGCVLRSITMDATVPTAELAALLGRGTHFEGKLHFEGRVRIDGSFRGEIRSEDTLVIGDGADIDAEVIVSTLIIRGGKIHGQLRARNCIELYVPAEVSGSLHAPEIYMDKGVQFSGTCTMAPLEE